MDILICVFLLLGIFFGLMSVLGLYRFPDVYTRLHASTKGTTFGAFFVILAVVIRAAMYYHGGESVTVIIHSLVAFVFIIFTNPVGSHAIARGTYLNGIKPYGCDIDDLDPKKANIIPDADVTEHTGDKSTTDESTLDKSTASEVDANSAKVNTDSASGVVKGD